MGQFWTLLKESVIVQALLTLGFCGATIYLACTGREVPQVVSAGTTLVLGFYFGSKTQQIISGKK